ncbi:MAG: response regulator [Myxococcaceae bacterium]|nr:response regulator [Myxococcaceae bacterium]
MRVVDEMEPGDVVKAPLTVACVRRVLERSADAPRPAAPAHRAVLVADDNAINRNVARRLLERLGCTVTLAANGVEAVEAARTLDFDVVFVDCQMPVLDGYDATRAIRALGGTRGRVPIVAMTANALPGDRDSCLEAGMDDYLAKPVRCEDLAQQLHALSRLSERRRSTG